MIEELWILPPVAIGRLGSSKTPCRNFEWGPSDTSPSGTGKTTLTPLESLDLTEDGEVLVVPPEPEIVFKDQDAAGTWRFRPVCPFFELHGRWTIDGQSETGPITPGVLEKLGLKIADVRWTVSLANLKAYQFTLADGDRVECELGLAHISHARWCIGASERVKLVLRERVEPGRRVLPDAHRL